MNEQQEETIERGGARFHFDPSRIRWTVPTLADVEDWARNLMRDRRTDRGLAPAFASLRTVRGSRSLRDGILQHVPIIAGRRRRRLEDEAVGIIRPQLETMHLLMLEFMVDLTDHPLTPIVVSVVAILLHDHAIEEIGGYIESHARPDDPRMANIRAKAQADHADAIVRNERADAALRRALENEALHNLMHNPIVPGREDMMVAALMAARDEIGDPDSIRAIDEILSLPTRPE